MRKQKVVDQLVGGLAGLLKRRKVTIYDGWGTLGPGHVGHRSAAASRATSSCVGEAVVIATGSVPRTIPGFDVDGKIVVTSDEMLSLQPLPPTAAVIGGGAIGCEFASMMADLGTKVTILEALPKILPGCDDDITKLVLRQFKKRDIDVRTGVAVTGHSPATAAAPRSPSARARRSTSTWSCVSVGRRPYTERRSAEGTAVVVNDRGFVEVDDVLPHRPSPASTPSATSSPRRRWPTSGSSRASPSSRTSSARTRSASTTPTCRGASTATPRSPSPATASRPPRTPASTSWCRATATSATAGPSSSASPTAW